MLLFVFLLTLLLLSNCCDGKRPLRGGGRDDEVAQEWLYAARRLAQDRFANIDVSSNRDVLAVVILLTDFDRVDKDRVELLRASLQLSSRNLFSTTPSRLYVFTLERQVSSLEQSLGDLLLPNMAVLPILKSTWRVPYMAGNRTHWHSHQTASYRIMGDWRLAFMPAFARDMGHRYVMQLDDDSFILRPVGGDLVRYFDSRGFLLGARSARRDPLSVTWGLPELVRYFLVTSKVVPTQLFDFCEPPSIEGLYSEFKSAKLEEAMLSPEQLDSLSQLGLRTRGGWNRTILFGNLLMYNLDWFFRPEVQHFVQLCRSTGGSFAYRWNEQGVIAMLWQIFVPRDAFHVFRFDYQHRVNGTSEVRKLLAKYLGGKDARWRGRRAGRGALSSSGRDRDADA